MDVLRIECATRAYRAHEKQIYNLMQQATETLKFAGIFILGGAGIFMLIRFCGRQTIIKTILTACGLPIWIANIFS